MAAGRHRAANCLGAARTRTVGSPIWLAWFFQSTASRAARQSVLKNEANRAAVTIPPIVPNDGARDPNGAERSEVPNDDTQAYADDRGRRGGDFGGSFPPSTDRSRRDLRNHSYGWRVPSVADIRPIRRASKGGHRAPIYEFITRRGSSWPVCLHRVRPGCLLVVGQVRSWRGMAELLAAFGTGRGHKAGRIGLHDPHCARCGGRLDHVFDDGPLASYRAAMLHRWDSPQIQARGRPSRNAAPLTRNRRSL
jgi:hypothetical protein